MIGRDDEVRRAMTVLSRRVKNNPILIGEPGVGKTAIVEGLAQRIASGDVPEALARRRVLALDMGALAQWVSRQDDGYERGIYSVVDLHALTTWQEPAELTRATRELAKTAQAVRKSTPRRFPDSHSEPKIDVKQASSSQPGRQGQPDRASRGQIEPARAPRSRQRVAQARATAPGRQAWSSNFVIDFGAHGASTHPCDGGCAKFS